MPVHIAICNYYLLITHTKKKKSLKLIYAINSKGEKLFKTFLEIKDPMSDG